MAKRFIVGNWKAHKTVAESLRWLEELKSLERFEDKEVIVCPPFTALSAMKQYRDEHALPLYLGAQNASQFTTGAYTGEIPAVVVKELADYIILGHSERREHYAETDEILAEKVRLANEVGFSVIFCVQGQDTPVPPGVSLIAYEPVFAIGSGTPDTPENAEEVAKSLKQTTGVTTVLYGGSVKPENIASFSSQPSIDGALVGGASLEANSFLSLIHNA